MQLNLCNLRLHERLSACVAQAKLAFGKATVFAELRSAPQQETEFLDFLWGLVQKQVGYFILYKRCFYHVPIKDLVFQQIRNHYVFHD